MNPVVVHDVVTLGFLLPYAYTCLVQVMFDWTVYPMFTTHALLYHMVGDLVWIYIQPRILPKHRGFIIAHHLVAISLLVHLSGRPQDARIVAYAGLIEFDTSLLLLRRLFRGVGFFDTMYLVSNLLLRVHYETFLTLLIWYHYRRESVWVRVHAIVGQVFINVFSCGICAMTYSKRIKEMAGNHINVRPSTNHHTSEHLHQQ